MPVYAYKCRDCGTPLEVHQEFSAAALTECPVCGGVLRKQYGTIGVTFNGSGFYRTDSRAGSGEGGGAGGAKSESGGESKSDTKKSEPAPAAKTEPAKPAATAASSGASSS